MISCICRLAARPRSISSSNSSGSRFFFILIVSVRTSDVFELGVDLHQDSRDPAEILDDIVKCGAIGSPEHAVMIASSLSVRQMAD